MAAWDEVLPGSLSLVATLLLAGSPAPAQLLRGTVVDSTSGQFVAGAIVTVLDTTGTEVNRAVTGADSQVTFHLARAGDYRVRVMRIGYLRSMTELIGVSAAFESIVRLTLLPTGLLLDTLTVLAESVAVEQRIPWLADVGFYERRRTGFGYFLGREDIDELGPVVMSDLFVGIPGLRVKCLASLMFGCSITMPAATTMFLRGKCQPSIVLDGMVVSVGGTGGSGYVDQLNPFDIEAVEIYTSAAGVPV
jgi:carboxypeptidase family protein/TonB-dependent receptor-like protein